jgi:hypothetical protein
LKKLFKNLLGYTVVFISFIALYLLPTFIIPPSAALTKEMEQQMGQFFSMFLVFSIYSTITYWLLVKNTGLKKKWFFVLIVISNFIIYPLMGLLESLFWGSAFGDLGVLEHFNTFARLTITYIVFSATVSFFALNGSENRSNRLTLDKPLKEIFFKLSIIAVIFFVIYNLFGYFIAWQFEETRLFYTGSTELKSFIDVVIISNLFDFYFVGVHLLRGFLFALAGFVLHKTISANRLTKVVLMGLFFSGFGFQLIMPNPFFPELVRVSHFIETSLAMLLFGSITGHILTNEKNRRL